LYAELLSVWQRETESSELVPLPSDFYSKVSDYVGRIEEELKGLDKKTLRAGLLEHEMQNVRLLVRKVTRIRCRKLKRAIAENQKTPPGVLTPEEEKMCSGLLSFAQAYRTFAKNLIEGQAAKVEAEIPDQPHRRIALRFLKPIPAIVGSDMKTYGPFAAEDVASLPVENARVMVKQGLAAIIETS